MTGAAPGPRHSLCGGEWRGPFDTDNGPVEVCNTCGEERPSVNAAITKTYGPRQAKMALSHAEAIKYWGAEMLAAVEAGNLEQVRELAAVIATATDNLAEITARAAR